jgi:hypothetical protein
VKFESLRENHGPKKLYENQPHPTYPASREFQKLAHRFTLNQTEEQDQLIGLKEVVDLFFSVFIRVPKPNKKNS